MPVIGDFADILNAGIYAANGEFTQAGISGLSALPFLGTYIAGAKIVSRVVTNSAVSGRVAKKGALPDSVFSSKAPKQTTPGTKTLEGQHINDQGRVEPWKAHYDDHGRQIGRTDYNAGNKTQNILSTHHHTKEYNAEFPVGRSTGDHIPGEY